MLLHYYSASAHYYSASEKFANLNSPANELFIRYVFEFRPRIMISNTLFI